MVPPALPGPRIYPRTHHLGDAVLRLLVFVVGWLLVITGLGLGVTVVLLPAGVVVGVFGLCLALWAWASPGLPRS